MDNRVKAAFSYVFGFITGLVFLAIEKDDEFVRKSAAQSTVLSLGLVIVNFILRMIPFIGGLLSAVVGFGAFLLWIILIVKAIQNVYYRLPLISDFSERYVVKWFR